MKFTRTFQIELAERKSDDGKRVFAATLSSETPVVRRDFDGEFREILRHTHDAVDLSRAKDGLPLLESHDARSLPIGIVTDVRLDGGKLRGIVSFGASTRAREVEADVAAGVIRNLSIGYSISKAEKSEGKTPTLTAVRWMPHEVSAVAIGADPAAGIGRAMDPEVTNTETTTTRDAATLERERCTTISTLTRKHGLAELGETLIRDGVSLADARSRILDELARRDDAFQTSGTPATGSYSAVRTRNADVPFMSRNRITAGGDNSSEFRAAAVDALLLRAGVPLKKPHPAAGDVSGSIHDIARTCLSRAGKSMRNGGGDALVRAGMTTSDFPLILVDATHAAVRNGYETEPASHRQWVRPQAVPDFKVQNRPILGSAPALLQVNEHAEYTNGSMSEDAASYSVAKFGKIVGLTWETLVNDSLGAFLRVQPAMGQAARRKEADLVYALFALNAGAGPTMQDTVALWHSTHGNDGGAAAAFDAARLGTGRSLLRKMTALGGGYMSLVPRYLIVPSEREHTAETLLAAAARAITTVDDSTPRWISSLELVVEPRLANTAVYLAADSSQIDHCELGLLEENFGGPTITEDRSEEFRSDVFSWKVRHVFGAKFLDWRGIVRLLVS